MSRWTTARFPALVGWIRAIPLLAPAVQLLPLFYEIYLKHLQMSCTDKGYHPLPVGVLASFLRSSPAPPPSPKSPGRGDGHDIDLTKIF